MNPAEQDRVERLICRLIDGEIGEQDRRELDRILAVNVAARELLEEYRRIDQIAAVAVRHDFENVKTAAAPRKVRGLWLATASGVLAAAAVVAFSFVPYWTSDRSGEPIAKNKAPINNQQLVPDLGHQHFVDYRPDDYWPLQRQDNLYRDLIGIRGKNPNQIYILERNRAAKKVTPISGEF